MGTCPSIIPLPLIAAAVHGVLLFFVILINTINCCLTSNQTNNTLIVFHQTFYSIAKLKTYKYRNNVINTYKLKK